MSVRAFIPRKIKNITVLRFFELLRKIQKLCVWTKRYAKKHLQANQNVIANHGRTRYIEDQNSYHDMVYGRTKMSYSGCEIIAVYNSLIALSKPYSLVDLINSFEHDGMVLGARFGTSPRALTDYFIREGYRVLSSTKACDYDDIAGQSDVIIMTMYNDCTDIMKKVHTICISHDDEGYTAHNVYGNGRLVGPYEKVSMLMESINNGLAKGIYMIGICKHAG